MSLTHSAEEIINKAAAILGKYVPGEALGDVEHETISRAYDSTIAEIDKIISIADRNEVPDLIFETVARIVAIHAASMFSSQAPDLNVLRAHEQRLRELLAQTPTYEVLGVNYF